MKKLLLALLIPCLALIVGCSESVDDEYAKNFGDYVSVTVDLGAASPGQSSRAANTGQYVADVEPWELMRQYRVVFAGTDGTIYAVVDKEIQGDPVESDAVSVELRTGDYMVYAFANIPTADLSEFVKGATIPSDLATRHYFVSKYFSTTDTEKRLLPVETFADDFAHGRNVGIPMTSVCGQAVHVTERVNQRFGIEVRRLFAKLQFDFSYRLPAGSPDLRLKSQSVSNLTVNEVKGVKVPAIRMMNYEGLIPDEDRTVAPLLASGFKFDKLSHSYGAGLALTPLGATSGVQQSQSFYVLESLGDEATNSFELEFDVEKAVGMTPEADKVRYGITNPDNLTCIHRNDWIRIPVTIGEWTMDLDVYCYPPIGGYPEAHIDKPSETEFHVTFDSPGAIALYPSFHRYFDDASKFTLADLGRIVSVTIDGPKGDDIFVGGKAPRYKSGEITATLATAEGTAYIDVTTVFRPDPAQPAITKSIKRRIYLTRKN